MDYNRLEDARRILEEASLVESAPYYKLREKKIAELMSHYIAIAKLDYWYLNPEEGGPISALEIDFWYTPLTRFFPDFNRAQKQELGTSKLYKRSRAMRWYGTHGGYSMKEILRWDAKKECCACGLCLSSSSSSLSASSRSSSDSGSGGEL